MPSASINLRDGLAPRLTGVQEGGGWSEGTEIGILLADIGKLVPRLTTANPGPAKRH